VLRPNQAYIRHWSSSASSSRDRCLPRTKALPRLRGCKPEFKSIQVASGTGQAKPAAREAAACPSQKRCRASAENRYVEGRVTWASTRHADQSLVLRTPLLAPLSAPLLLSAIYTRTAYLLGLCRLPHTCCLSHLLAQLPAPSNLSQTSPETPTRGAPAPLRFPSCDKLRRAV